VFIAHCNLFSLIQYFPSASLIRIYLLDHIALHLHLYRSCLCLVASALYISCTVICRSFPSDSLFALFLSMTHVFVEEAEQFGSMLRHTRLKWNGPLSAVHTCFPYVWWGACGEPSTSASLMLSHNYLLSQTNYLNFLSPCTYSTWYVFKVFLMRAETSFLRKMLLLRCCSFTTDPGKFKVIKQQTLKSIFHSLFFSKPTAKDIR